VASFVAGTRIGSALGRAKTPPLGLTRPLPDKFFWHFRRGSQVAGTGTTSLLTKHYAYTFNIYISKISVHYFKILSVS